MAQTPGENSQSHAQRRFRARCWCRDFHGPTNTQLHLHHSRGPDTVPNVSYPNLTRHLPSRPHLNLHPHLSTRVPAHSVGVCCHGPSQPLGTTPTRLTQDAHPTSTACKVTSTVAKVWIRCPRAIDEDGPASIQNHITPRPNARHCHTPITPLGCRVYSKQRPPHTHLDVLSRAPFTTQFTLHPTPAASPHLPRGKERV